jgi:hypothetical protein
MTPDFDPGIAASREESASLVDFALCVVMVATEDTILIANSFVFEDRTGVSFMIANDDVATQTGGGCKVRAANDYDIDAVAGTGEEHLIVLISTLDIFNYCMRKVLM